MRLKTIGSLICAVALSGAAFAQAQYGTAEFARPGDPKPVPKVSYVTKVGDIYCGVGYYKQ
jgi:hypothetical protein